MVRQYGSESHNPPPHSAMVLSYLLKNVIFSSYLSMHSAEYISLNMSNYLSGLESLYYFQFRVSFGVAVKVKSRDLKLASPIRRRFSVVRWENGDWGTAIG